MKRNILATVAAALFACAVTMGASCSQVQEANPISAACKDISDNLAVCAYATYGTFVIFEEQAVKVTADPALPLRARAAIVTADQIAKPVVDSLYEALLLYQAANAEIAAGNGAEAKLLIATGNLNRWVTEAAPLVANLVNAVTERGKKS